MEYIIRHVLIRQFKKYPLRVFFNYENPKNKDATKMSMASFSINFRYDINTLSVEFEKDVSLLYNNYLKSWEIDGFLEKVEKDFSFLKSLIAEYIFKKDPYIYNNFMEIVKKRNSDNILYAQNKEGIRQKEKDIENDILKHLDGIFYKELKGFES